jgi:hypothetical protein
MKAENKYLIKTKIMNKEHIKMISKMLKIILMKNLEDKEIILHL